MAYTEMDETPKEDSVSTESVHLSEPVVVSDEEPEHESEAMPVKRPERVRRTKSGPQIYGLDSMGGFDDSQGVIREDIKARSHEEDHDQGIQMDLDPVRVEEAQLPNQDSEFNQESQTPQAGPAERSRTEARTPQEKPAVRQAKPHGQKKSGKASRMVEASRRALRSPLLILVALFLTIYFLGGVAAVFMRELSYGQFAKLISSAGIFSQLSGYMSLFEDAMHQLDTGPVWMALAIRIPDLLLCVGLWLLVITGRTAKERMSGSGYFFMRFSVVIHMIVSCILLLAGLVVSVTMLIASWGSGTGNLIGISVAVLVAAIIVTMVVIMYYFCYLGTVKSIQMNASRGEFYGKVSIFVAVVQIVLAFVGIISILSGIVNAEITGIVTGAGRILWMALYGIWICCYRKVMKNYEE